MKKIILMFLAIVSLSCNSHAQKEQPKKEFEIKKSEAEWKAELSPQEFQVLRKEGTERAFSSPLLRVSEAGTFVCAACGNPLYKTENKFNSGTGWPSFDRAISDVNVTYREGTSGGFSALEVLCGKCGGHLGHVFNDGPDETTGIRHCVNGIALNFIPEKK
ncbi:MAG TPA: peptide-methionine (R)-S-oxide reductase MsrB [Salinimicrobium sp.]|nr:peptide-methionine (R)-S-oxide reductase MsrB [Salinimicrobium sp.]